MRTWNKRLVLGLAAAPLVMMAASAPPAQAAAASSAPAAAAGPSPDAGAGYGGGMGPGMMGGGGPGFAGRAWQRGAPGAAAPGWQRGGYAGYGPGMMRGYGYDPGMMGGYGGHAGYGGHGRCGAGAWGVQPQLTQAQRTRIEGIEKAMFRKQWALMESMHRLMFGAWKPAAGDRPDVDAIMKRATAMSNLRLQMLRNRLEASSAIEAVLTPQQRRSLDAAP